MTPGLTPDLSQPLRQVQRSINQGYWPVMCVYCTDVTRFADTCSSSHTALISFIWLGPWPPPYFRKYILKVSSIMKGECDILWSAVSSLYALASLVVPHTGSKIHSPMCVPCTDITHTPLVHMAQPTPHNVVPDQNMWPQGQVLPVRALHSDLPCFAEDP